MAELRVATMTGPDTVLEEGAVDDFRAGLRGEIICPGDLLYEGARKVWNGMIDRRPGLIVRCAGVSDAINSVNFARTNSLLVSVRGGGHNVAGNSVCDAGMVIDTSRMKGMRVDPISRTARAQAGLTLGEYDRETQVFALASPAGTVSDTGIAGLTLGGGIGWLSGKYGLACDNLLSVDIVTADGSFLTVSDSQHQDLFWGVKGAGGNFGVVTSFEYQLHSLGPVMGGMLLYPFDKAKETLKFYRDFSSSIPDEMNTMAGLMTLPDGSPVVGVIACHIGPFEAAEKALRPLREFGPPISDEIRPRPYVQFQSMLDQATPAGRQYYFKSNFTTDISDEVIDALVEYYSKATSPLSMVMFQQMGAATTRVSADTTAFDHREAVYDFVIGAVWEDPGESEVHVRWARDLWEATERYTTRGIYINNLGIEAEDGADQIRAGYRGNYQRLAALKNKYDPANLFRHNPNIRPAG